MKTTIAMQTMKHQQTEGFSNASGGEISGFPEIGKLSGC